MANLSFGDLTIAQIVLIGVTAFFAQILGGLAGYGTGLLMPLVLVPLIGAQAVVPVISLSSLLSNITRVTVFRDSLNVRKMIIVTLAAIPTGAAGAWFYTWLSSREALLLIGTMLVVLVPLRRFLVHRRWTLGDPGLATAGAGYGLVMGATSGSGVILLSILMAAGLNGTGVIATDAGISFILSIVKTGVFISSGVLPPSLWLVALLIGIMATPGALTAKWLARRFSVNIQNYILEATIVAGGLILLGRALLA
jgi:uncharacterized membrane protein YfcA